MTTSEDHSHISTTAPGGASNVDPFLRGFIGSAILLLAADFAEPIFFGQGYYASLSIHPYWIIVLLAAVQSGLYVGVAIAGLATLMMDWPTRPIGVDITTHYIDTAILPLQWLIAALAIGAFRQSQLRDEARLRQENARLAHMNDHISREVLRLDAALARSELAAVTRPEDPAALPARHASGSLARLAEASRLMQAEGGEPLPRFPVALLTENAGGGYDVQGDGVVPWMPPDWISDTHPVAVAIKGLKGEAIVRTDDASFVCRTLPQTGSQIGPSVKGVIAAILTDEKRATEVRDWLRLLAPLVSVALAANEDVAREDMANDSAWQDDAAWPLPAQPPHAVT